MVGAQYPLVVGQGLLVQGDRLGVPPPGVVVGDGEQDSGDGEQYVPSIL